MRMPLLVKSQALSMFISFLKAIHEYFFSRHWRIPRFFNSEKLKTNFMNVYLFDTWDPFYCKNIKLLSPYLLGTLTVYILLLIHKIRVYFKSKPYTTLLTFTCSKSTIETREKMRHMFKVDNKNTRTTSLTGVFIVNLEHISHLYLLFLYLILNK